MNDDIQKIKNNLNTRFISRLASDPAELERVLRLFIEYTGRLEKELGERRKACEERKSEVRGIKNMDEAVLLSIGEGIFVVNKERSIIMANKLAGEFIGVENIKNLKGKRYSDVIEIKAEDGGKNRKLEELLEKTFSTGEVFYEPRGGYLLSRKAGKIVPVSLSVSPVRNLVGSIIGGVVVFNDVSWEVDVDKMKTEFVSVASHQLRTPLSAMQWFAEMLLDGEVGDLNDGQRDYVQQIFDSNERMINLVNDLLNVSRLEMGKLSVTPKLTQLEDLVRGVINEFEPLARAQACNIEFKRPTPKTKKIFVDPSLIRQVIYNLISNAIRYSKTKGHVVVTIEKGKEYYLISVADNGIGIPREQQKRVFEKFFRADLATKLDARGTGLGLYISKMVVETSGGRIWFHSEEGRGTAFYVELPIHGSSARGGAKELAKAREAGVAG